MLYGARQMLLLALRQRAAVEVIAQQMKVAVLEAIVEKGPVMGEMAIKNVASNKLATDLLFKSLLTTCLAVSKQMPSALLRGGVEALQSPEFKEYLLEMVVMNTVNFVLSKTADINTAGTNLADIKSPTFNMVNKIAQVFTEALFSKGLDSANETISNKLSELLKAYPDAPTPLISDQEIELLSTLPPDEIEKKMNEIISQKLGNMAPEVTPLVPVPPVAPSQAMVDTLPMALPATPGVEQALPSVAPATPPIPANLVPTDPFAAPPGVPQPLVSAAQDAVTSSAGQILRRSLTHSFQETRREPKKGLAGLLDEPAEPKTKTSKSKDHGKK